MQIFSVKVMPQSNFYTKLNCSLSALLQGFVQCMHSACMSDSQIALNCHACSCLYFNVPAGTWVHAGYHLGTTIAVPAAVLPLPFAFSQLTWGPGLIALLLAIGTTTYSSYILAGLFNWNGKVYYRYRDLVRSIFGELLPGCIYNCNAVLYTCAA